MYKKLALILAFVLFALLADRLVFTSNDVKIQIKPEVLKASTNSEMQITVYRANLLGFKVPFSSIEARFEIEEGGNLIELASESTEGTVKIRSKGIEGEATVGIYTLKSGLQIKKVLIKILPIDAA